MTRVEQNYDVLKRMIKSVAASFVIGNSSEFDDLISSGWLAVWKAELAFDGRGNFVPYAIRRAKWGMKDYLRSIDPLSRKTRKQVKDGERESICFVPIGYRDPIPCGDFRPRVESTVDAEAILNRSGLNDRHQQVVMERVDGEYFHDIGDHLGVNESRACQIYNWSMGKLREAA